MGKLRIKKVEGVFVVQRNVFFLFWRYVDTFRKLRFHNRQDAKQFIEENHEITDRVEEILDQWESYQLRLEEDRIY